MGVLCECQVSCFTALNPTYEHTTDITLETAYYLCYCFFDDKIRPYYFVIATRNYTYLWMMTLFRTTICMKISYLNR